ncbi:MAG: hypothetical protein GY797_06600, partial [Deltaproteobacteria bacterium]|nr:hypothetical protein [Deltaproteobacteria bacterium]
MARRTPEEILAQRDAWLARKTGREAGEDIPVQPPLKPGQVAEAPAAPVEPEVTETTAEPETAQPAPEATQPVEAEAVPEPAQPAGAEGPKRPAKRRTPEEILAQREAFLAKKAARAAGQAPPAP